jgi:dTMP kinase
MIVVFEGIDGSGKTTQARKLVERLTSLGVTASLIREPTPEGKAGIFRELALSGEYCPQTVFHLMLASRAQMLEDNKVILDDPDHIVVLDRYIYSTIAYQSIALGKYTIGFHDSVELEPEILDAAVASAGKYLPSFGFYLDITPNESQRRLNAEGNHFDTWSLEKKDLLVKAYDTALEVTNSNIIYIDGIKSKETVEAEIWEEFQSELLLHGNQMVAQKLGGTL